MTLIRIGAVAALSLVSVISMLGGASAAPGCKRMGLVATAVTQDFARFMVTQGLKNHMYDAGLKGRGAMRVWCDKDQVVATCHSAQLACK